MRQQKPFVATPGTLDILACKRQKGKKRNMVFFRTGSFFTDSVEKKVIKKKERMLSRFKNLHYKYEQLMSQTTRLYQRDTSYNYNNLIKYQVKYPNISVSNTNICEMTYDGRQEKENTNCRFSNFKMSKISSLSFSLFQHLALIIINSLNIYCIHTYSCYVLYYRH